MADRLKIEVILSAFDRASTPFRKITDQSKQTTAALRQNQNELKSLKRLQQDVSGFRAQERALAESGQQLEQQRRALRALQSQYNAAEAPTKKQTAELRKQSAALARLQNDTDAQRRALDAQRAKMQAAGISTAKLALHERDLANRIDAANRMIDKQRGKLDQLAQAHRRMQTAKERLSRAQSAAGAAGGIGASSGAAAVATAAGPLLAVKAYAQWEDAMLGVARQVPGARDAAGNLTRVYFDMGDAITGLSKRLPMAATEIAALVEAGARMGIKGQANLIAFAETTAIASTAFELPAAEIGDNMAKIAGVYKIPIANIRALGDTLNWLDDNTQSKGGDIIDVLQRMGDVADKMSYGQAAALGSTFLSLGTMPEVAASAGRAMVRELAVAQIQGKRFQAGIKALGLDSSEIQRSMSRDATGTIFRVLEAIKRAAPDQQTALATQLFGDEYGDDAAKLANNLKEYRKQLDLVESAQARGSMQKEADARLRNLSARWQLLKNSAFDAGKTFGATVAPALVQLIDRGTRMLGVVTAWVQRNPELAAGMMKVAIGGAAVLAVVSGVALSVSALLGPLAMARYAVTTLGIRFGPLLSNIMPLARNAIPMLLQGARLLLPLLGGISAPVLAIGAAVGVVALLIWKYWQPIKAFMSGVFQGIGDAARPVLAQLSQAMAPLRPVWDWFAGILGKVWGWVRQLFTPFQATNQELQNATNYGRIAGQVLGTVLLNPIRQTIGVVATLARWLRVAFDYSPLGAIMRNWTAITTFLSGLWPRMKTIGGQIVQGLIDGVLSKFGLVTSVMGRLAGLLPGTTKKALEVRSPSRVFAQIGDFAMQGLAGGLQRSAGLPLGAMGMVNTGLRRVAAGAALSAAVAPSFAIDTRPALQRPSSPAAMAGLHIGELNIHVASGADARSIATEVRAELEALMRERQARSRSALSDYGN